VDLIVDSAPNSSSSITVASYVDLAH
jgi:hypothetical protein